MHSPYNSLFLGLEEFEEKMSKLGEPAGEESEEQGWINSLIKEFGRVKKDVEEEISNEDDLLTNDVHDIEPPLFDPKWSLGVDFPSPGTNGI